MSELGAGSRPRLAAGVKLRPDPASGKLALLAPETILLLNQTSAAIVELCDGRTLGEIADALSGRFSVGREQALAESAAYLGRLRDRGLVES